MGFANLAEGAVFVCDDVSRLEYRDGLFYLTDVCGSITITRAMRPHTFLKCVTGAYALAKQWEREQAASAANVVEFQRIYQPKH